jgi:hypothetical protein
MRRTPWYSSSTNPVRVGWYEVIAGWWDMSSRYWWDSGDEQRGVLQTHLEQFAALIEEHLKDQGYRQCAKGQRTTQFCGMLKQAVKAEREGCRRSRT